MISAALPAVKMHFFRGDSAKAAGAAGIVDSLSAALSIVTSALLGEISDRVGRRPLLFLSVICTLGPIVALLSSANLLYYYVVLVLVGGLGIGQSNALNNAMQAYVADCSDASARVRNMGLLSASSAFVFMIMPQIGLFLQTQVGQMQMFALAAWLEIMALVAVLILPESVSAEDRQLEASHTSIYELVASPIRKICQEQGSFLWDLALVRFVEGLGTNGLGTIMVYTMTEVVKFQTSDFALLYPLMGWWGFVVNGVMLPFLAKSGLTELQLMLLAQVTRVFCYSTYSLLGFFPFKITIFILESFEIFTSVWDPAFASLLTKCSEQDKGLALGLFVSIDSVTNVISPIMMAFIFQFSPTAPWLMAAMSSTVALTLLFRIRSGQDAS